MTREQYAYKLLEEKYSQYNIDVPMNDLPSDGTLIETTLNDNSVELVDRLTEFTLCALYSFYFIDRYCYTYDPQTGPIPLKLYDFQKNALGEFQNHSKNIFRKSRQVGASIISGAYCLWRANFHKAQFIKIISLTQSDALEFKEKTIDLNYYEMPGFLKTKTTRDGYSKLKLKMVNQSHIKVLAKSKNAGRGGTPSLIVIDEAAFNEWMDDIWKSIEPSLDKGGDCIVISTTNGVGNWYHITYSRAEQHINEFNPIFIPWWRYPNRSNPWLQDILDGKIENVEEFVKQKEREQLSYEGPPENAPWLWKRYNNAKSEKEFQQEILAEFLGSGTTVTTQKAILRLEEEVKDPVWVDTLPSEIIEYPIPGLWCWQDRKPDHMYMLSADTATGHGKDYSAFHVVDIYDQEQVAEYKYQLPTDKYGEVIKQVARYYNQAYVVIESNHPGPAVFNEVYKSKIDPYFNVYLKRKSGDVVSWETTAKSRILLIEDYFKDVENGYTKIHSKRLVDEVKVFNWNDRGKPEALRGYNDDLIIAYAMYCHLKEKVYTSRPTTISSTSTKSVGIDSEVEELEIENFEQDLKNTMGVDLNTYYWLQDKEMPDKIKKYKQIKSEKQDKINIERPPEWLSERVKNGG